MSSPTFSDALSYVVDAQAEILSAVADWKSYADAAAEAYSQAYEDQGRVLGSVNKRLEEMRKGRCGTHDAGVDDPDGRGCWADRVCPGERQGRERFSKS